MSFRSSNTQNSVHQNFGISERCTVRFVVSVRCAKGGIMSDIESVDMPDPSTVREDADGGYSCQEVDKFRLKDALVYYEHLLSQDGLIAEKSSAVISEESMLLAEDLYKYTIEILSDQKFVRDAELIMADEDEDENSFEEVGGSDSPDESQYEPEEKKIKSQKNIPVAYKIKVCNIAKAYPSWSLKTLHKKGCSRLNNMKTLKRWEDQIKSGGSAIEKYEIIDSWTYDRFTEARQSNQQVTTRNLQQWGLSAASQFDGFDFKASASWVERFKRNHRIRQRKITKFVSEKDTATMEETLSSAENFRVQARALIPNFDRNFVINTDQTGC